MTEAPINIPALFSECTMAQGADLTSREAAPAGPLWKRCFILLLLSFLFVSLDVSGQESAIPHTISVVTDDNLPPYVFRNNEGELQGIIIDQWRAWEKRTGVTAEIHGMDWNDAVRRMKAGEFDVIDAVFKTPERTAYLDFGKPYATIEVPIFFRSSITGINNLSSLHGFPVAARLGDSSVKLLQENAITPMMLYNNYEAIITAAGESKVNVFVMAKPPAQYFLQKMGIKAEFRMSDPINIGEFHRAVHKGRVQLLQLVEQGFEHVGGHEESRIKQKWFGQTLDEHPYLRSLGYAALAGVSLVMLLLSLNWILAGQIRMRTRALREREEQLSLCFNHSPAAIAMLDHDMRYLVVSPRWLKDYRLGEQNIVGRSHYAVFPEMPPDWIEIHRRCLAGSVEKNEDEKFVRSDGSIDWIRWEIRPWHHADGAIGGIIIFSEDITARKLAELALQTSESEFRTLIESASDGILVADTAGRLLEANVAACKMLGHTREELGRMGFVDIVASGEMVRILPELTRLNQGEVLRSEWVCRREDGTLFPAEVGSTLLPDGRLQCIMRDITRRKMDEDKIREQASLLDKARDAIIVCGPEDHHILYWNRSAERLYGWQAGEVLNLSQVELLNRDSVQFFSVMKTVKEQGEWAGEMQQFDKEGRLVIVESRWTLIKDAQGRPQSILSINTDITERKKLEQQFLRAQRMESIGTLAGGIAHDLNNVLAPIMMAIELLKLQESSAQKLDILSTIEGSATRGADLVKQVLSFARGVEGRQLAVQVGHLLKEIEKIVNETFLKGIQVCCEISSPLWVVQGDPTQIHQVLLNLSVNARDAMPNGGQLKLSATNLLMDGQCASMIPGAKPGQYLHLQVADNGTGMSSEVIERMFEPFFTTKELGKGTGLGLSSVMAIVKSHHGFLRVESELGAGTTFHIYLPAHMSEHEEVDAAIPGDLPRGAGELILVVDDEAAVQQITKQTLETFGYRVLLAADGAEAVSLYSQYRSEVALVLTDMMMPVMDGPATIQVLMRMNPEICIIAASGMNAAGMEEKAANTGVKNFLPKPYTAETLLKTLDAVLHAGADVQQ
ncbi:PAS domain S-box protein [Prosthecobacter sp.]|uniref:PAS domain S-box protein n=1 Tax=Prosthecobacter sp. TaxID=1965333 RepID=UPI002487261F|nr:PAS domain S-box protein [Prosthecobacter sp.]MDI1312737.1 PAS domain S-box protein [Prosthecobacter sp.]